MSRASKKKAAQLEMSFGTACHRLRKKILFALVREIGYDTCFRCEEKITNIDNFSIEHKIDWLDSDNPKELFFSLDNIAFSHMKCNYAAKRNTSQPLTGPEGTAWCSGCQTFVSEDQFGKNPHKDRRRELRYYCNTCRREKRNWGHS